MSAPDPIEELLKHWETLRDNPSYRITATFLLIEYAIPAIRHLQEALAEAEETLAYCDAHFQGRLLPAHNHPTSLIMKSLAKIKSLKAGEGN